MRAVRISQHGGPEVLRAEAAPTPTPRADEVLVRVRACALNHLDLFIRAGIPGVAIALPRILGSDIAGEVGETGEPVLVAPGVGCGVCHFCLDGRDNECRRYQIFGYQRDGGYAETVSVPRRALLPMAAGLDYPQAASMPLVFLTAWNMLVRRAQISPGQTVLVWAASSGVGIAAVQIAKLFGCRVIATAGGRAKLEMARALGADAVTDHYDAARPVARAVKEFAPEGVDVVVEHVGQASWEQSLRALAPNGVLVTCGATTGHEAKLDLRFLFSRQLRLLGSYMGRRADLDVIVPLISQGKLRPVVDRVFPLAEAEAAHAYLGEGRQFGKVVLEVG
ncbi:MAG TPA: zinc-binding dehydrogenase [Terriglobales bacterium]|nr:zinc-binding dehydrogenase [Terriglobales bacterium]